MYASAVAAKLEDSWIDIGCERYPGGPTARTRKTAVETLGRLVTEDLATHAAVLANSGGNTLRLTHRPRDPNGRCAGLNFGARGRGKRAWRWRSWTCTDALSKVCIVRSIQLYNVSWAQLKRRASVH
eukprot:2311820-Prymnesium_polylepis.2